MKGKKHEAGTLRKFHTTTKASIDSILHGWPTNAVERAKARKESKALHEAFLSGDYEDITKQTP